MQYCAQKSALQLPGCEALPAPLAQVEKSITGFIDLKTGALDSLVSWWKPAAGYLAGGALRAEKPKSLQLAHSHDYTSTPLRLILPYLLLQKLAQDAHSGRHFFVQNNLLDTQTLTMIANRRAFSTLFRQNRSPQSGNVAGFKAPMRTTHHYHSLRRTFPSRNSTIFCMKQEGIISSALYFRR